MKMQIKSNHAEEAKGAFLKKATGFLLLFLCLLATTTLFAQRPVITHNIATGPLTIDAPKFGNDYVITGVDTSKVGHPIIPARKAVYYSSWIEVTFSAPFQYTGGSIVIGILNNNGSYTTGNDVTFRYSPAGANRTLATQTDTGGPLNPAGTMANGGMSGNRSNTRFNVCTTSGATSCSYKIIGTDTLTGYSMPIHTFYNYSYVQHIFTAAELGITNGQWINKIAFEYAHGVAQTKNPITIYMGNTTKNNFTAGSDWVPVSSMTQVFSGSITFPAQLEKWPATPQIPAKDGAANVVTIHSGYQGTITLDNLHIKTTPITWKNNGGPNAIAHDGRSGISCITVEGVYNGNNKNPVTKVNVKLKGNNRLCFASDGYCAFQVNQGAQIHINSIDPYDHSSGTLKAECTAPASGNSGGGAAIGAPNFNQDRIIAQGLATPLGANCPGHEYTAGGNIIISSGTVNALGGHGAGIGGGWYTWYDGLIIITNGIINARAQWHSAGIGAGCPNGNGVESCRAPNSAIIALPPCKITACGVKDGGCLASLSLAGAEFISYVNDPQKPKINIRTVDYEPQAPIYLDLTTVPGLQATFNNIYPTFALNRVWIGQTDGTGIIQLNCWFQNPVTFFTTASSTKPATWGRPYLPNTTTTPGTQSSPNYEVVLQMLQAKIEFQDQWAYPLCVGYTNTEAVTNAYRLRIDYKDPLPLTNLTWQLQDGANSSFQGMTFQKEVGGVLGAATTAPTQFNNGDVWVITIPIKVGKPLGYYLDVLLIGGTWNGSVPFSGYLRRIGRQRVVFCPQDLNFCVTTTNKGFSVQWPVTASPTVTVPLSLTISHANAQNILPYDPKDVLAYYTISKSTTYAGARAEKPVWQWTPLRIPANEGVPEVTTFNFANMDPGVYYVHWFVESGTGMGFSGTVVSPNSTCGGFGPYIISLPPDAGEISCTGGGNNCPICPGTTTTLVSVNPATGGSGTYTYRWEYSTTSSPYNWVTAPGTNNTLTYTTATLSAVTYFRRVAKDTGTNIEYPSNIVTVSMKPATPTFTFTNNYCIGTTPAPTLPGTSDNGIAGTWRLNTTVVTTVNTAASGSFNYQFTPNTGNCNTTPVTYTITINAKATPTFTFPTTYCFGASPSALPATSSNGYAGTWSPNAIVTNDDVKTYTYLFTPNTGVCATTVNVNVTINGASITSFTYPSSAFCIGSATVETPTITGKGSYTGGTFTATPAGLSLNATTGAITTSSSTAGTYTVTYTSPAGSCPSATQKTTVTLNSGSGTALNYSTLLNPLCTGTGGNKPSTTTTYSPTITGGPTNQQGTWEVTAPGVAGTQALTPTTCFDYTGTNAGRITLSTSCTPAPNTYTITFKPNLAQFPGACNVSYTWKVNAMPSFTLSYPTTICTNAAGPISPTITCSSGVCSSGTFSVPTGLSINASTGVITPSTSTPGSYTSGVARVSYTIAASGGCSAVTAYANGTTGIVVIAPPAQPGTITGPTTVCKNGANITLSVAGLTNTATWTVTSGIGWSLVSQSGTNNSSAEFKPGTGNAVISVTQGNSCGASPARTYQITVIDAPGPPIINGLTNTCSGTATNYTVGNPDASYTYQWAVSGSGWSPTSGTGQSISITPSSNAVGTITLTANNGSCTTSSSVTVTALPTTIPAPTTITYATYADYPCRGATSLTYTVPNPVAGYSYTWSGIPSGWSIVSGQFSNVLVLNATATALPGTLTVTASTACASSSRTLPIMVNDIPQLSGLLNTDICASAASTPLTFNVGVSPATATGITYTWTISGSITNTTPLTSSTPSLTIIPGTTGGTVKVTATNRCGTSNTLTGTITVTPLSTVNDFIANSATICLGSSINLNTLVSAPGEDHVIFRWYTTVNGTTNVTNPASVSPTQTTEYFVSMESDEFCEGAANATGRAKVTITVNTPPSAPGAITSSAGNPICSGTATTLSVPTTGEGSASIYEWSTGNSCGANIITGNTNSISVTPTTTTTYWVRRKATAPCTNTTTCSSLTVTVTTRPSATISYTTNQICRPTSNSVTTTVTLNGTTGGTYTMTTGTGVSINSTNGTVTVSNTATAGTYTVTYTLAAVGGCPEFKATATVSVTIPPDAPGTISSSAGNPICNGMATTLSVPTTGEGSGAVYEWGTTTCGSNIITGTGASISVTPTTTTTYWVRRKGTGPCSTTTTACSTLTVTVNTPPDPPGAISSSAGNPICNGIATTLSVPTTGEGSGAVYEWGTNTCGTGTVIGTSASISVTPTTTTTYWVRRKGTGPCTGTTTSCSTITITVNTPPSAPGTINSSAGSPICSGMATTLSVATTGEGSGATYQWGAGNTCGTNPISGNTNSISVTPTTTTTYWVRRIGTGPCTSTTTGCSTITITVNTPPDPPGTITSSAGNAICTGNTTTLTVPTTGEGSGANYQWGTGNTCGSGTVISTTNSVTVTPTTTTTYWVRRIGTGPCTGTTTTCSTFSLTVNLGASATISYTTNQICRPTSGSVTTNVTQNGTTGGTYTITTGTGVSINSSNGTVSVTNTATAGTYTVTYTLAAAGGCPEFKATATVSVTIPPDAPGTISSSAGNPICNGMATTLSVPTTGEGSGAVYEWGIGTTCGSSIITGNTNSISVTPTTTTTYWVRRKGTGPCSTTTTACSTLTVTVNTPPDAPGAISSSAGSPICRGSATTLSVATTGEGSGATYEWGTNACGSGTIIGTSASISVTPTTTTTYWVRRVGAGPCSTTTTACSTTTVTVTIPPDANTNITYNPNKICLQKVGNVTAAANITGTTGGTYSISSGSGVSINSSNGTITATSTATPGTYTVTYTIPASGGCPEFNTQTTIPVHPQVTPTFTKSPSDTLSIETTQITLTASGGQSYVWTYNGVNVGNTAQINVTQGGFYVVTVTNTTTGCSAKDSVGIKVTVYGTVFPFVKWQDATFNNQFDIKVSLRPVPVTTPNLAALKTLKSTAPDGVAKYYSGNPYIPGTPEYGGFVGGVYNFNYLGITWHMIKEPKTPPVISTLGTGVPAPVHSGATVGYYKLSNLPGNYILEINRAGFVTRWAPITLTTVGAQYQPHREIIPGDVADDNLEIDGSDGTQLFNKIGKNYPQIGYDPAFDLNADGKIDQLDYNIVIKFKTFNYLDYIETDDWLK